MKKNWIDCFRFELCGTFDLRSGKSGFHARDYIHVSVIEEMVETIKPKIIIPAYAEKENFSSFDGFSKVIYDA